MMNTDHLNEICARKNALIAQCEAQRATLAQCWEGLQRPITTCNKALTTLRSPYVLAGLGLLALKLPTMKLLRLPMMIWKGASMVRRVHSFLR